jgi:VIT1/CCC1 family predicted Fe2+/Mn2+ transporter
MKRNPQKKTQRRSLPPATASILLFVGGVLFLILNFTVLPIVGMVVAVILMLAAIGLMGKARKRMVQEAVNRK